MAEGGDQDSGEKEFEATEQRLRQARRDGDVPQSKEANALALFLGVLIAAFTFNAITGQSLAVDFFGAFHHADAISADVFESGGRQTTSWLRGLALKLLPIFLILLAAVSVVIIALQSYSFSFKKIKPDMKKLNPVENLKKKYGAKGFTDFLRDAAKMLVAGLIASLFLFNFARDYYGSSALQQGQIGNFAFSQCIQLIIAYVIFQFLLTVIDLPLQQRLYANRLKMTREQLKKETKDSEGDPLLKQQRRAKAQKLSKGEMLKAVETATVVMVNPTHYAVALTWDPDSRKAPILVAKGVDHIAARIREIAIDHNVPIYSDPPNTRAIYAAVDLDEEIHPEHFAAVAAAIQYVDRVRGIERRS